VFRSICLRASVTVTVAVLLGGAGAIPAVRAATAPGWRITAVLRHCGNDSLSSVVAIGPRDAWAVGEPPWSSAPGCGADVERWDGTTWRRVPVPAGVSLGDALTLPLAAVSASDAWIFPARWAQSGYSYSEYSYALHWDGAVWQASSFPARLIVQDAAALGSDDGWAFGVVQTGAAAAVPFTAHYNGRTWQQVRLPVAPLAISTQGRGLWVIGPAVATAASAAAGQHLIAMRWNGRSWSQLAVPDIAIPAGQDFTGDSSLAATGSGGLWWYYQVSVTDDTWRSGLLHWDGAAWHTIAVPGAITQFDAMTQDGRGGIWLAVGVGLAGGQYWYHYSGGHWTRQLVGSPSGYGTMVFGMSWIPGTASAWAVGEADANVGTRTVGVIAQYGA
jgi:hypothetical protein